MLESIEERAAQLDKQADSIILDANDSGAKKHRRGKLRVDLIPPEVTKALAEGFGLGVEKGYDERNWEKGLMLCGDSLAAAKRHILKWELGENINVETSVDGKQLKIHHLKCALVNLAMAVTQVERGRTDLDDRYKQE